MYALRASCSPVICFRTEKMTASKESMAVATLKGVQLKNFNPTIFCGLHGGLAQNMIEAAYLPAPHLCFFSLAVAMPWPRRR